MDALASQIGDVLCSGTADPLIEQLQVESRLVFNPSPPSIDVYPSDPFQEALAMGAGNNEIFFNVRARVSTAENEGGQDLLLSMMDPAANTSVLKAILSDRTLGNVAQISTVEGPSAFGVFPDPGSTGGSLLGCTWRVGVFP